MKTKFRLLFWQAVFAAMTFMFATSARAEGPRDEIVHAYRLIASADADYGGHRGAAMEELHHAGKAIGLHLEGDAPEREHQWKSDRKLTEARRLLHEAKDKLEARDRDRVADHVDRAIHELDAALKVR